MLNVQSNNIIINNNINITILSGLSGWGCTYSSCDLIHQGGLIPMEALPFSEEKGWRSWVEGMMVGLGWDDRGENTKMFVRTQLFSIKPDVENYQHINNTRKVYFVHNPCLRNQAHNQALLPIARDFHDFYLSKYEWNIFIFNAQFEGSVFSEINVNYLEVYCLEKGIYSSFNEVFILYTCIPSGCYCSDKIPNQHNLLEGKIDWKTQLHDFWW